MTLELSLEKEWGIVVKGEGRAQCGQGPEIPGTKMEWFTTIRSSRYWVGAEIGKW